MRSSRSGAGVAASGASSGPRASTSAASPLARRGRSSLTHPVQAAQHFAREEFGDDGLDAYPPIDERWHGDGDPVLGAAHWTVRLGAAAGAITVELAEHLSEPLLSTCAATRSGRVRQWELRGIARD